MESPSILDEPAMQIPMLNMTERLVLTPVNNEGFLSHIYCLTSMETRVVPHLEQLAQEDNYMTLLDSTKVPKTLAFVQCTGHRHGVSKGSNFADVNVVRSSKRARFHASAGGTPTIEDDWRCSGEIAMVLELCSSHWSLLWRCPGAIRKRKRMNPWVAS